MPRLPTQADMAGPVSMAPQGSTPKIPSPAPMYDAQMDIGKAIQGVGNAISAEIKVADKEAEREAKADEAEQMNSANLEYRTMTDELRRQVTEKADGFDSWSNDFVTGADEIAKKVLQNYPGLSDRAYDKLVRGWDGYDRVTINGIEGQASKARIKDKSAKLDGQLDASIGGALTQNKTPDEVNEMIRQSVAALETARSYLPGTIVDKIEDEKIRGAGEKSIIYNWGKAQGAAEVANGAIATGKTLRAVNEAIPHAYARVESSRPMESMDLLTQEQSRDGRRNGRIDGITTTTGATYSGPMPKIEAFPDGKPFVPTEVPPEINRARPNYERGRMQLGVSPDDKPIEIPYYTGSKSRGYYPGLQYGAFTLLPHRVGEDPSQSRYANTISINPLGATKQTPIDDPKRPQQQRTGQLIHPAMGRSDNIGCISVPDDKWPEVQGAVQDMWKKYGKTNVVLVNAPGQTQIMSRQQYEQMYGQGGVQTADADTPAQAAEANKKFLVLPGLGGTYGADKTAFDDIARTYGGKADYLDGDPQFGGARKGRNGEVLTSPQVKAAVDKLASGDYDGIIGYSAGGYNLRQILASKEFQALPEAKQAKIQKVVALGLSDEHVKDFKLDARFNPEVYGNIGAAHPDAPRALAKQLGVSPRQQTSAADLPKTENGAFDAVYRAAVAAGSPNPRLTAAIAMHESAFGRSSMAQRANNLFGQTVTDKQVEEGRGGVKGATVGADGQKHAKYGSIEDAIKDHLRRWGKYYDNDPKATLNRLVENGYNVVDGRWADKVGSYYGRFKGADRTADAGAAPGRMNLGAPKPDEVKEDAPETSAAPLDPQEGDGPPTGFTPEDQNDPAADQSQPGNVQGMAETPTAASPPKAANENEAGPSLPGAEKRKLGTYEPDRPLANIDAGSGLLQAPEQKRPTLAELSPEARVFAHMKPEALLKLRNVLLTQMTDSGKRFADNAVAQMVKDGTDYRHPVTGQTYAEWAKEFRQPQQYAREMAAIRTAELTHRATANMAFMNDQQFAEHVENLRRSAPADDLAATEKVVDKLYQDRAKVEEIKRLNPAQGVSGFSIKRGEANMPVWYFDKDTGEAYSIKDPEGYARPHPAVQAVFARIKAMPEYKAEIVETPEGLSLNTSKISTPAVKQKLWGDVFSNRLAAQQDIGIDPTTQKIITKWEAQKFLGTVPQGDPGAFEKHWKQKAEAIERMVGPEWAPRVLREMRDFYVKGADERGIADSDIGERTRKMWQSPGAGWATTGKMEPTPQGPTFSMNAMRALERTDQLGRALSGDTIPDLDKPSIAGGMGFGRPNATPTAGAGETMNLPKKLMPDGAQGPATNMLPKINDQVRKLVIDNADNPLVRQAIDLKFGPNAFNRILADQTKKGR